MQDTASSEATSSPSHLVCPDSAYHLVGPDHQVPHFIAERPGRLESVVAPGCYLGIALPIISSLYIDLSDVSSAESTTVPPRCARPGSDIGERYYSTRTNPARVALHSITPRT